MALRGIDLCHRRLEVTGPFGHSKFRFTVSVYRRETMKRNAIWLEFTLLVCENALKRTGVFLLTLAP